MLKLPGSSRFTRPLAQEALPADAVGEFFTLTKRIAAQADYWDLLERFKSYFAGVTGSGDYRSSNASWAETDLWRLMEEAAENPPLFIEAFYDACEGLKAKGLDVPPLDEINRVLAGHGVGYEIQPPNLVAVDESRRVVIADAAAHDTSKQNVGCGAQRNAPAHRHHTEPGCEGRDESAPARAHRPQPPPSSAPPPPAQDQRRALPARSAGRSRSRKRRCGPQTSRRGGSSRPEGGAAARENMARST